MSNKDIFRVDIFGFGNRCTEIRSSTFHNPPRAAAIHFARSAHRSSVRTVLEVVANKRVGFEALELFDRLASTKPDASYSHPMAEQKCEFEQKESSDTPSVPGATVVPASAQPRVGTVMRPTHPSSIAPVLLDPNDPNAIVKYGPRLFYKTVQCTPKCKCSCCFCFLRTQEQYALEKLVEEVGRHPPDIYRQIMLSWNTSDDAAAPSIATDRPTLTPRLPPEPDVEPESPFETLLNGLRIDSQVVPDAAQNVEEELEQKDPGLLYAKRGSQGKPKPE
jgi:hypothetical protein